MILPSLQELKSTTRDSALRTRHGHAEHIMTHNRPPQSPSSPNMRRACRFEDKFSFMLYSIMLFGGSRSGCAFPALTRHYCSALINELFHLPMTMCMCLYSDFSILLSFHSLSLGSELVTRPFLLARHQDSLLSYHRRALRLSFFSSGECFAAPRKAVERIT